MLNQMQNQSFTPIHFSQIVSALMENYRASYIAEPSTYEGMIRVTFTVDGESVTGAAESMNEAVMFANDIARRLVINYMRELQTGESTAISLAQQAANYFHLHQVMSALTEWAEQLLDLDKELFHVAQRKRAMQRNGQVVQSG